MFVVGTCIDWLHSFTGFSWPCLFFSGSCSSFFGLRGSRFLAETKLSHEKNTATVHYTGWLIGILIMVYYNLYING